MLKKSGSLSHVFQPELSASRVREGSPRGWRFERAESHKPTPVSSQVPVRCTWRLLPGETLLRAPRAPPLPPCFPPPITAASRPPNTPPVLTLPPCQPLASCGWPRYPDPLPPSPHSLCGPQLRRQLPQAAMTSKAQGQDCSHPPHREPCVDAGCILLTTYSDQHMACDE